MGRFKDLIIGILVTRCYTQTTKFDDVNVLLNVSVSVDCVSPIVLVFPAWCTRVVPRTVSSHEFFTLDRVVEGGESERDPLRSQEKESRRWGELIQKFLSKETEEEGFGTYTDAGSDFVDRT